VTRSLRGRLALALGATAALSLAASAVITFGLVRSYTEDQALAELRSLAEATASEAGDELVVEQVQLRALRRVLGVSGHLLATVGPRGGIGGDSPLAREVGQAVDVTPAVQGRIGQGTVDVAGKPYAYVVVPVSAGPERPARLLNALIIARPIGLARDAWAPIVSRVLVAAGVAAALAALASTLLARRLTRPVRSVAAATARVAAGDLEQEVPVEGPDELADLARSFNAMSSALGEARRREGEFLASVSHELRTPVTAIRGYVEALDEGAVRDERGRAEALAVIKTETERLERLVRDVMDLARLGAQEFRMDVRDADLSRVVQEAAVAHRTQAHAGGVTIDVDAPAPLACRTDPDRVRQVITNLVENAVRVTPAGGHVYLTGRHIESGIALEIRDTGPGIAYEHLPHVFERAYLRTVAARDGEPSAGSGLGLAIVRELVRALGGRVEVASEKGSGTTFRVTLPPAA
jgi:two-component system, OmpR family, sensor kinase